MSHLILSFLPSERESLIDLQTRFADINNALLNNKFYEGIPVFKNDKDVGLVLAALREAINRRKNETKNRKFNYNDEEKVRSFGKTSREKQKAGYMSSADRKKRKSERDQETRRRCQGAKSKKVA